MGAGDEVLTTPLSFIASSNCLLFEDARPVFCDVDPATLTIDPAAVEAAVGEATAGHPARSTSSASRRRWTRSRRSHPQAGSG